MRIEFLGRNYTIGEKLKDVITKKVERLNKFFDDDTKVKIVCKEANAVNTLEITVAADKAIMRAEVSSDNMYNNIDLALPKLEKQIIKHRDKLVGKSKKFRAKDIDSSALEAAKADADFKTRSVVKSKVYDLIPMTVEDAIEELELVGHSFYVFANKVTDNVNVVYKRNDGDYGLIETRV